MACAIEYLSNHTFQMDQENPPMARAVEELGLYAQGMRRIGYRYPREEAIALISKTGNVERTIFLMRLGNLPFFLLACFVVGCWARRAFGNAVAVLALGLFT